MHAARSRVDRAYTAGDIAAVTASAHLMPVPDRHFLLLALDMERLCALLATPLCERNVASYKGHSRAHTTVGIGPEFSGHSQANAGNGSIFAARLWDLGITIYRLQLI